MKNNIKLAIITVISVLAAFTGGATAYYVIDNARQAEASVAEQAERDRLVAERTAQPTIKEAYMANCIHKSDHISPEIYCELKWGDPIAKAANADYIATAAAKVRKRFPQCLEARPDWDRQLCLKASADHWQPWSLDYARSSGLDDSAVLEICKNFDLREKHREVIREFSDHVPTLDIYAIEKLYRESIAIEQDLSKEGKCFLLDNKDKFLLARWKVFFLGLGRLGKFRELDVDAQEEFEAWTKSNGWQLQLETPTMPLSTKSKPPSN